MEYLVSLILITLSALFSGLTIGYFSLGLSTLERRAKHGNKEALAIYPLRKRGNLLLTTLLLGNVIVNTSLSIFLGSIFSGVIAGVVATIAIFLLGEVVPQAVISRHAVWFGSRLAPLMRFIMFILTPITYPIAYCLDKLLGHEMPHLYSKNELKQIVSELEDSEHSDVDADEERIVLGALQFSHTTVREIMTPREQVIRFDANERLNQEFTNRMSNNGFSRYPIYAGNEDNVIGIFYSKDAISEADDIKIAEATEAFSNNFLIVRPEDNLDLVLGHMLKRKQHMGIVLSRSRHFLGVVTLEDIIEEIIQVEIKDEDDE